MSVLIITGSDAFGQQHPAGIGARPHDQQGITLAPSFSDSTEQDFYFAILGPVRQPAVYSSTRPSITLPELVAAAGGLTERSSPLAQVIRNGRAGLTIVYRNDSKELLRPGDLVVFPAVESNGSVPPNGEGQTVNDANQPAETAHHNWISIVGLFSGQPVVVPLNAEVTSVNQIVGVLRQPESVRQNIRVIRTSHAAPRLRPGQLATDIAEGDVIVFDPNTIDREQLQLALRGDAFPPVIPLIPAEAASREQSPEVADLEAVQPVVTDGPRLPIPCRPAQPAVDLHLPTAVDTPRQDVRPSRTDVVQTSLIEKPNHPGGTVSSAVHETSAAQPVTSASGPNQFVAESFDRLAMAQASSASPRRAEELPLLDDRQAAVPVPRDVPPGTGSVNASRSTTLGITVLLIALMCFAVSIVWSRLDDSTGLVRDRQPDAEEQLAPIPLTGGRTFDRLVTNKIPLIEEQPHLPAGVDYHGDAVGRERLRMDGGHGLKGPSFAARRALRRRKLAIPAGQQSESSSQTRGDEGDHSEVAATTDGAAGKSEQSNDLLERVLMAMEREKRR